MKSFTTLALVACFCLLVAACSGQRSLVGKWEEIGGKEKLEFIEGGTISISSGGMSSSGKYSFVNSTHLKIELGGLMALAGPQIATFAISNDQLMLTDAKGKTAKYQRAK